MTLAVVYPDIEFKFMGKRVQGKFKAYAHMYDENAVVQDSDTCAIAIGRSDDQSFIPDFSHFESTGLTDVDQSIIHDRLMTLAVVYPDIEFKFMGKRVQGKFKAYAQMYDENAVVQDSDTCAIAIGRSDDCNPDAMFSGQGATEKFEAVKAGASLDVGDIVVHDFAQTGRAHLQVVTAFTVDAAATDAAKLDAEVTKRLEAGEVVRNVLRSGCN
ncbi:hypothetical protein vBKpnAMK4_00493 [Klebsiella phage vB_Kpn_AM_K4]